VIPELTVYRARNGWILTFEDGQPDVIMEQDDEVSGLTLLRAIQDHLGLMGSRYDAQRLVVTTGPGDKHHDLHPRPCSQCECGCVPDRSTSDVVMTEEPAP
jgi:hypothetical protein